VCQGLTALGWRVREVTVDGDWPRPGAVGRADLAAALAAVPDGGLVLLDGLVSCGVPEIVRPEAGRLRLVVLVHLPLGAETGLVPDEAAKRDALERETLPAAVAVVATSTWSRERLVAHHGLSPERVHVAVPGVDPAPLAAGTDGASQLVCVASVTPRKGQDVLVDALATLRELPWDCVCVGPLHRAPPYVERVRVLAEAYGLTDRIRLVGPRTGGALEATYAAADLLVLPSYGETYGMVVTEALARGVPVLATAVDGLPEALGHTPGGDVPGMLVPPGDPTALAGALRRWLGEPATRQRLRDTARARRAALGGWDDTARRVADVLEKLRQSPGGERE
jgi:glycosyltransferase involved in cell wall biosynthesis